MTTKRKTKAESSPKPSAAKAQPPAASVAAEQDGKSAAAFPIVGIGASAGGLAAFEAFFAGMPVEVDPGMAFVLVQHLAPDHKSILCGLIQRYTRMEVFEVEDGMKVRPNCAYIIPPGHDMAFLNGALQLLEPAAPRGQRLPIDFFFRSLASDQRERAIAIVLSGTGSDGTLGVRAVKGEGGMVMAQNPETTEYDGMPRSALATGLVDYELPPAQMPRELIAYAARAFGQPRRTASTPVPQAENALKKIFILLRSQTGHDFSLYKPSTIHRRIERRMAVHQVEALEGYVKFLQHSQAEVEALFRDLLIGVTSFFRDPEAFLALETHVIPQLFKGKSASAMIRVWTPGCSTGEEAYSLAILLAERQEAMKQSFKVQVFATDIDSQAIATARTGLYPASIAGDLSPERLARFFKVEPDGSAYRIHKSLRDMLVFSEQDVIKDPPFSKLDLISCRNLLIYMGSELQKRLIPLFHYSLLPGGVLFLGTSETVGEHDALFAPLDRNQKLYQRRLDLHNAQRLALGRFLPPMTATEVALPRALGKPVEAARPPMRELIEQALLQHLAPAGALVNSRGDILYLHGRTGLYLEPTPGEAGISNILKMAREGLRHELATALHKAASRKEPVRIADLRVKTNGDFTSVNLTVSQVPTGPEPSPEAPLYLVILEQAPALDLEQARAHAGLHTDPGADGPTSDERLHIEALRQELHAKEEYLQTANEELETSNEELKSSNEEMQSVNEELATVNAELQVKLSDLSRANNDMNNLLAGTNIATVFVDHGLRILRFTPAATQIINLITSDVGRPVGHIVSNLVGYDRLADDVQAVLDRLITKELEVPTTGGSWYTLRIMPYRTLDNVIEGAVITFVDITDYRKTREALRHANEQGRLAVVVRDAHDAITVQDLEGRTIAWNPGAVRMYGWCEAEALGLNIQDRIPEGLRNDALAKVVQLSKAQILEADLTQRLHKNGSVLEVSVISTALVNEAGQIYAIATTERPQEATFG